MSKNQLILNNLQQKINDNNLPKISYLIGESGYEQVIIFMKDKLSIDDIDIAELAKEPDIKSIGIKEAKNFKNSISSKALKNNRLGIIYNAEKLTTEAANSLLKIIEELPEKTYLLIFSKKDQLIPTIKSRIIYQDWLDGNQDQNPLENNFFENSLLDNLLWIEKNEKKINIEQYIKSMIFYSSEKQNYQICQELIKSINLLNSNVNRRLVLESLAIKISRQQ